MNSIYHYTLSTGHMRRSFAREVKKEVRARVRELIKFERNVACNYTIPFLDGTKIPFIVDIPTQYCILIADWSGDFCRTLAWSIFDDSETSED